MTFPRTPCHELNRMADAPHDDTPIIVFTTATWATHESIPLGCFVALGKNVGLSTTFKGWWPMPSPLPAVPEDKP